jgi:hypothetical protein
MCRESALEKWMPIKFEPDVERIYAKHMLERFVPLARLAYIIAIAAYICYHYWDILLDPFAFDITGPIRLIVILNYGLALGLTFLPVVRKSPKLWPYFCFSTYTLTAIGLTASLSQ